MTDKSRNDEDQCRKNNQNTIKAHALHFLRYGTCDGVQETRRGDGFAKRQATSGKNNNSPQEVIKVFLREDASAKEEDNGYDGHDTHVSKDILQLMCHTPEYYSNDGNSTNEPLYAGKLILHRPYWHDCGAFSWLEGDKKEYPDKEYGDNADGEGDKEPDTPAWLRPHVLECDDILRRSDGGGGAANVRGEGDAENEGFGEIGVRR